MENKKRPKIGVGVIIRKEGRVLLGKRKGAHGEGTWSFPGGHLEFGESPVECAKRETLEEANVQLKNLKRSTYTNDFFEKEQKHYVTLYVVSDYDDGELKVMEPDKCEDWKWFSWDDLPKPLFVPVSNLRAQGYSPFED